MASGGTKSAAFLLLILNLGLYLIVTIIAAWAANHAVDRSHSTASVQSPPEHMFPIYFPFGNTATGIFIIFSLLAGAVGIATSLTGLAHVLLGNIPSLIAAAASSFITWSLTLLAMGLACNEINIGYTDSNLRTLEVLTIIVSATQLFCTGAIHVGAEDASRQLHQLRGRA